LRKLVVSMGLVIASWFVGYSVAVLAAEVVAGTSCFAVAWSLRRATPEAADEVWDARTREEDMEAVERAREADAAAALAEDMLATAVRGEAARRAGMDRARDRRAAMIIRVKGSDRRQSA
jgi:hypothetical protein